MSDYKDSYIYGDKKLYDLTIKDGIIIKKKVSKEKKAKHYFFPPFIDTHNHFMAFSLLLESVYLYEAKSIVEIKENILNYINNKRIDFVLAEGWDENFLEEKRSLNLEDLENISKDIPIFARRIDGHITILNTAAKKYLRKKGLNIDKDYLLEKHSLNLSDYLDFPEEIVFSGFNKAVKLALSLGVSGVSDFLTQKYYKYYKYVKIPPFFTVNYYFIYPFYIEHRREGDNFNYEGIKLFADGSIGANTAMVSFPYLNKKGNGMLLWEDRKLGKIVRKHLQKNDKIAIHAIGNLAAKQVLNVLDNVKESNKENIRLEHLEFIDQNDLLRIKRNNVNVSMQPNFIGMWGLPGGMYEAKFGKNYIKNNRVKSVSEHARIFAFGSDNMPFSPSYGIYYAMNHPYRSERINLEQAIKYYSFNGYKLFGKSLEFMAINKPITALYYKSKPDIKHGENFLTPHITFINGEKVYEKN